MENIFTRVKSYMKSQYFFVNDSWLSECAEYFISTNPQSSAEAVQKFVLEQYLLSDLREINDETRCLPPNLAQEKKTILIGKYTLQLLLLYDISVSKFKQLEKIRNVSVDNIEATKEENSQNWEPQGKRMLQLFLTDGKQEILAVEHKPIRVLNDSLLPGLKLMIIGPVTCRRGVILLEEFNISTKGGEVEDFLITNAVENVLARKLKAPLNPDPYKNTKVKKEETPANDLEDDFHFDLEEIEKIERSQEVRENQRPLNINQNYVQSISNSNSTRDFSGKQSSAEAQIFNQNRIPENINEFPTDEDLDFDFDDIEIEEIVPPSKNNINSLNPSEPISKSWNFDEPKQTINSNLPQFPDDDLDLGDVDFDSGEGWDKPVELPKNISNSKPATSFRNDFDSRESDVAAKTGIKRTTADLSPLPTSNSKVRCAQSTPKISQINRKITDFVKNAPPKENLPPKICDYICDVLTESLTDQPIRKTVRGKLSRIGKLTKKNFLWILNGTIQDESGSADVDFSSQFMEKVLGFSVSEFSQLKKKIKSDPKMEEQLRKQMLDGQNSLETMDCLLELELKKDKKPVVLSSRELTHDEKINYDKRFRMLKFQMT